jgi:hypothetical protein
MKRTQAQRCCDCGGALGGKYFTVDGRELRCEQCHFGFYVVFCPRCKWSEKLPGPGAREMERTICITCEKDGAHIHFERVRPTA